MAKEDYWMYKAEPAPEEVPEGVFATKEDWLQLSPGYRRTIARIFSKDKGKNDPD